MSHLQTHVNDDLDGYLQSPSALVSVGKLTLDLFHSWLQPWDLRFLSITHLFLDRARFVRVTDRSTQEPLGTSAGFDLDALAVVHGAPVDD